MNREQTLGCYIEIDNEKTHLIVEAIQNGVVDKLKLAKNP